MEKSEKPAVPSPRKPKNLHANHRQRMLKLYRSSGAGQLYPHQLLELLLFYSIPRQDTNPIAHRLLDAFGSISNLLDCSTEELCTVKGIGPSSAKLIRLVAEVRTYLQSAENGYGEPLYDHQALLDYLHQHLTAETDPGLYLLLLDGRGCPFPLSAIQTEVPHVMDASSIQTLLHCAFSHGFPRQLQGVILVDQRKKVCIPSAEDMFFLSDLKQCLNACGMPLLDYLIYTPEKCISLRKKNLI